MGNSKISRRLERIIYKSSSGMGKGTSLDNSIHDFSIENCNKIILEKAHGMVQNWKKSLASSLMNRKINLFPRSVLQRGQFIMKFFSLNIRSAKNPTKRRHLKDVIVENRQDWIGL